MSDEIVYSSVGNPIKTLWESEKKAAIQCPVCKTIVEVESGDIKHCSGCDAKYSLLWEVNVYRVEYGVILDDQEIDETEIEFAPDFNLGPEEENNEKDEKRNRTTGRKKSHKKE